MPGKFIAWCTWLIIDLRSVGLWSALLTPVYQEKVHLFRPVDAYDQCLFDVGGAARSCRKCYERGQLLVVFVLERDQSVADVIEQLIGVGDADMNGGVYTYRATAGVGRAQDNASGPGDEVSQVVRAASHAARSELVNVSKPFALKLSFSFSSLQKIFFQFCCAISAFSWLLSSLWSTQKINLPCSLVNCSANSISRSCCDGWKTECEPSLCGNGIGVDSLNACLIFFKMFSFAEETFILSFIRLITFKPRDSRNNANKLSSGKGEVLWSEGQLYPTLLLR